MPVRLRLGHLARALAWRHVSLNFRWLRGLRLVSFWPLFFVNFSLWFYVVCVFVVDVVCDVCAVCAVACLVHFTTDMSDEQQSGPDRMGLSSCGTWTRWVLK